MIDTIIISNHNFNKDRFNFSLLEEAKLIYERKGTEPDQRSDVFRHQGKFKNFTIRLWKERITIMGSLPKYYYGNNFQTLTHTDLRHVIDKLSDELEIQLSDFNVYRIDIGENFIMQFPISYYLNGLLSCPDFNVNEYPNESKIFHNKNISLLFYDKKKEFIKKTEDGQDVMKNLGLDIHKNYLSYELQIKRHVSNNLSKDFVTVSDLFNPYISLRLGSLWLKYFQKIVKQTKMLDFQSHVFLRSPELKNSLAAVGADEVGKQELYNLIQRKYKSDEILYQNSYRMRKMLNELENKFCYQTKYMKELDEVIHRGFDQNFSGQINQIKQIQQHLS